jgi:type IV pilus assembly protein PilV
LIEVLLTLLILAVGLLGLASMQALALRQQQQAVQVRVAAGVAGDLLETLRASRQQATAGAFEPALESVTAGRCAPPCDPTGPVLWAQGLRQLPDAKVNLRVDRQGSAHVLLRWSDPAGALQELQLRGRP